MKWLFTGLISYLTMLFQKNFKHKINLLLSLEIFMISIIWMYVTSKSSMKESLFQVTFLALFLVLGSTLSITLMITSSRSPNMKTKFNYL